MGKLKASNLLSKNKKLYPNGKSALVASKKNKASARIKKGSSKYDALIYNQVHSMKGNPRVEIKKTSIRKKRTTKKV